MSRPSLDFHHFQFGVGHDGVAAAGGHLHHVPCLHGGLYAVDDGIAAAGDDRPHLIPAGMAVVVHVVAGVQRDLDGQAFFLHTSTRKLPQDFSANMICWSILSTKGLM